MKELYAVDETCGGESKTEMKLAVIFLTSEFSKLGGKVFSTLITEGEK